MSLGARGRLPDLLGAPRRLGALPVRSHVRVRGVRAGAARAGAPLSRVSRADQGRGAGVPLERRVGRRTQDEGRTNSFLTNCNSSALFLCIYGE